MSIARRLWAALRLVVLAGACGVGLALAVAGSVLFAYRWGEARATAGPPAIVVVALAAHPSTFQTGQLHGGVRQ